MGRIDYQAWLSVNEADCSGGYVSNRWT